MSLSNATIEKSDALDNKKSVSPDPTLTPKPAEESSEPGTFRSVTSMVIAGTGSVMLFAGSAVAMTVVGLIIIDLIGLGLVPGLLILVGGGFLFQYIASVIMTGNWNPFALFSSELAVA
jgi:hypothetical protein